eukprot:720034-Lingulodinium_polyedra.AAC.1
MAAVFGEICGIQDTFGEDGEVGDNSNPWAWQMLEDLQLLRSTDHEWLVDAVGLCPRKLVLDPKLA